jgi:hypothetical protein
MESIAGDIVLRGGVVDRYSAPQSFSMSSSLIVGVEEDALDVA